MAPAIKTGLLLSCGEEPAQVLSALARRLCAATDVPIELDLPQPSPEVVRAVDSLPLGGDAAQTLIDAREALLHSDERRRRGAHFTPHAIAHRLAALALDAAPPRRHLRVCDLACGAGTFLVAAYRQGAARGLDLSAGLWGSDIDELSVEISRIALALAAGRPVAGAPDRIVCGDPLTRGRAVWESGTAEGFDVIVGNPPFLNQLRRASARSGVESARLAAELSIGSQPYADTSALFLARAVEMLESGGVVALIQPQSLLASRDTAEVRALVDTNAPLIGLWLARRPVFAASVRVCAPIARKGAASPLLRRYLDAGFDELTPVPRAAVASWADLAAGAAGVPDLPVTFERTLRDVGCRATAGFRDQYYGLVGSVREGGAGLKLVTAGSIEPLELCWGRQAVTFAKQSFVRPVIDATALAPEVAGWVTARLRPKLLVATQTKVIEAIVDEDGSCVPCTPVIEVTNDGSLWHIAAVLTNPVTTAFALRKAHGAALAFDALKLSARQVLDLPVPADERVWDRGARLAERAAHAESGVARRTALKALGEEMCAAYGAPAELTSWWLGRLRRIAS